MTKIPSINFEKGRISSIERYRMTILNPKYEYNYIDFQ